MSPPKKLHFLWVPIGLLALVLVARFGSLGLQTFRTRSLDSQAQQAGLTTNLAQLDLPLAGDAAQNRANSYDQLLGQLWKNPTVANTLLDVTSAIGNSYNTKFRLQLDPTIDRIASSTQAPYCNLKPSTGAGVESHSLPSHSLEAFTNIEMLWRMGRLLGDRAEYRLLTHDESRATTDAKAAMILANDVATYPWSYARFWGEGLQRRLLTMIGLRSLNNPKIKSNLQVALLLGKTYRPPPSLSYTLSGDFTYLKFGLIQPDLSTDQQQESIGGLILGTPNDLIHASMKALIGLQTAIRNKNCIGTCVQFAEDKMDNNNAIGALVAVKDFQPFAVMDLPADTMTLAVQRMLHQVTAIILAFKKTHRIPSRLPIAGEDNMDPVSGYPIGYIPHESGFEMWTLRAIKVNKPDQQLREQRLNTYFKWSSDQLSAP